MKTAAWIGVLALAAAGVAACGDDTSDGSTSGATTTGGMTTTGAGGAGGDMTTTGGMTTTTGSMTGTGGAGGGAGGAGGGEGGAGGGGLLPFGSPCMNNAQCESNICNAQQGQMLCTIMCTVDADCPGPVMDCNNNGFCKP